MEGHKDSSGCYTTFVTSKRPHEKVKNVPKTTLSAGNFPVVHEGPSLVENLHEALQLKIGKLCVEKGELVSQILHLENRFTRLEEIKNDDNLSSRNRIVELENSLHLQAEDLGNAKIQITELISNLRDANNKINEIHTRRSRSDDEKSCALQNYAEVIEQYETKFRVLCKEKELLDLEFDLRLQKQKDSYEEELKNLRTELSESSARTENQTKNFEKIVDEMKSDFKADKDRITNVVHEKLATTGTEIADLKTENTTLHTKCTASLQVIESLKNELDSNKRNHEIVQEELEEKLALADSELEQMRAKTAITVNDTMRNMELQLRDVERQKDQLSKELTEEISQSNSAREAMQHEYEKQILDLTNRMEDDYSRRKILIEETLQNQVQEWKAEYTKMRETHQQYAKIVDERLEQHTKALKERHTLEVTGLQEQIKKYELASKEYHKEIAKLQQKISEKESDLKKLNSAGETAQKKLKELEEKVKAANDAGALNDVLATEVTRLKQLKDPVTITQAVLKAEREVLNEKFEREYCEKINQSKGEMEINLKLQVEKQQNKYENEAQLLKGHIVQLQEELRHERLEIAKRRSEFVEKKRNLEDQLKIINAQYATETKSFEQKHSAEVKILKNSHEGIVKRLKTEKVDAIRCLEAAHRNEIQTIEDKYKTERSFLLRQHREEQRELLSKIGTSSVRDYVNEINLLQRQIAQLDSDHQRIYSEMEQSFSRVLMQFKSDHQQSVEKHEKRLQECLSELSDTHKELVQVKQSLTKAQENYAGLQDQFDCELRTAILKRENEYNAKLKESAEKLNEDICVNEALKGHALNLENELEEAYHQISLMKETQEKIQQQYELILLRNSELEANHASLHKKLRQSEDKYPRMAVSESNRRPLRS